MKEFNELHFIAWLIYGIAQCISNIADTAQFFYGHKALKKQQQSFEELESNNGTNY